MKNKYSVIRIPHELIGKPMSMEDRCQAYCAKYNRFLKETGRDNAGIQRNKRKHSDEG